MAAHPAAHTAIIENRTWFIIFGILLIVAPFAGALAVSAWIGIYALLFGIMELAIAFQLLRARRRVSKASGEQHEAAAWHQRPKHA